MKVIFTSNIHGVASRGDIKNVKNGYFRNFLFPRSLAVYATPENISQWDQIRKNMLIEREQLRTQFEEIKRRLSDVCLKLEKKITSKGTLYGGVKEVDVVSALKLQFNLEVPVASVQLAEPIKKVGSYNITLQLGEGIAAELKLEVIEKK